MSSLFNNTSAASTTAAASNTPGDITKDIALTSPPEDGISEVAFSPAANYLAVSSWDKKVRIYEVQQSGATEGKALFDHEGPVLSCCWSKVSSSSMQLDKRYS
jgi:mRNA export factor